MAHALCPNGHSMWDGDGKTSVYVFRIEYIREFCKNNPDIKLIRGEKYSQMYDITDGIKGEEIDCWYCYECKAINAYVDDMLYQYKRINELADVDINKINNLDEYIAVRNDDFEKFQEYYEHKNPIEAIDTYNFQYKYRVSKDKNYIYAINKNGKVEFMYKQLICREVDKN